MYRAVSSATARPNASSTTEKAMSRPAATPADVTMPSATTRCSRSTVTVGYHEEIDRRCIGKGIVRNYFQSAGGSNGLPVPSDCEHSKWRGGVGATRLYARFQTGAREDLERSCEVQDFHVVEDQDANVQLGHVTHSTSFRTPRSARFLGRVQQYLRSTVCRRGDVGRSIRPAARTNSLTCSRSRGAGPET